MTHCGSFQPSPFWDSVREAAPLFSEINRERIRLYAEEFFVLSWHHTCLRSPFSVSILVCCAGIYSLFCCSKGRGVTHCWICQGNVTKLLFQCVSRMLPWLAHCWHTAVSVMKTNTWYFHLMVHARGINIQWDGLFTLPTKYSGVRMCRGSFYKTADILQVCILQFASCGFLFICSNQNAESCNPSLE